MAYDKKEKCEIEESPYGASIHENNPGVRLGYEKLKKVETAKHSTVKLKLFPK